LVLLLGFIFLILSFAMCFRHISVTYIFISLTKSLKPRLSLSSVHISTSYIGNVAQNISYKCANHYVIRQAHSLVSVKLPHSSG